MDLNLLAHRYYSQWQLLDGWFSCSVSPQNIWVIPKSRLMLLTCLGRNISKFQVNEEDHFLGTITRNQFPIIMASLFSKMKMSKHFFPYCSPIPASQSFGINHNLHPFIQELKLRIFTPNEFLFITPQLVTMRGASDLNKIISSYSKFPFNT